MFRDLPESEKAKIRRGDSPGIVRGGEAAYKAQKQKNDAKLLGGTSSTPSQQTSQPATAGDVINAMRSTGKTGLVESYNAVASGKPVSVTTPNSSNVQSISGLPSFYKGTSGRSVPGDVVREQQIQNSRVGQVVGVAPAGLSSQDVLNRPSNMPQEQPVKSGVFNFVAPTSLEAIGYDVGRLFNPSFENIPGVSRANQFIKSKLNMSPWETESKRQTFTEVLKQPSIASGFNKVGKYIGEAFSHKGTAANAFASGLSHIPTAEQSYSLGTDIQKTYYNKLRENPVSTLANTGYKVGVGYAVGTAFNMGEVAAPTITKTLGLGMAGLYGYNVVKQIENAPWVETEATKKMGLQTKGEVIANEALDVTAFVGGAYAATKLNPRYGLTYEKMYAENTQLGEAKLIGKGFNVAGRPVLWKTAETNRWTFGTPTFEQPVITGEGFIAQTPAQERIVKANENQFVQFSKPMQVDINKFVSPEMAKEYYNQMTQLGHELPSYQQSIVWDRNQVFAPTETTGSEVVQKITTRGNRVTFGGESTQFQMLPEYTASKGATHDIDQYLKYSYGSEPRLQYETQIEIPDIYSSAGYTVKPTESYSVEVLKNGAWDKAWEGKAKGVYQPEAQVPPTAYGWEMAVDKNTINIEGAEFANLRAEFTRHIAATTATTKEGSIGVSHEGRYKDFAQTLRQASTSVENANLYGSISAEKASSWQNWIGDWAGRAGIEISGPPSTTKIIVSKSAFPSSAISALVSTSPALVGSAIPSATIRSTTIKPSTNIKISMPSIVSSVSVSKIIGSVSFGPSKASGVSSLLPSKSSRSVSPPSAISKYSPSSPSVISKISSYSASPSSAYSYSKYSPSSISSSISSFSSYYYYEPPSPKSIVPYLSSLGPGGGFGKFKMPKTNRATRYQPSLVALDKIIKVGKMKAIKMKLTGFEIRPIGM